MTHICTSRCNNDIDCEICPHGENIAQDECQLCYDETQDAEEKMNVYTGALKNPLSNLVWIEGKRGRVTVKSVEKLLDNEIEQEMLGR